MKRRSPVLIAFLVIVFLSSAILVASDTLSGVGAYTHNGSNLHGGDYAVYKIAGNRSMFIAFLLRKDSPLLSEADGLILKRYNLGSYVLVYFNASSAWLGFNITSVHGERANAVVWLRIGDHTSVVIKRYISIIYKNGSFIYEHSRGEWFFLLSNQVLNNRQPIVHIVPPYSGNGRVIFVREVCVNSSSKALLTLYRIFPRYIVVVYNISLRVTNNTRPVIIFQRAGAFYDVKTGLLLAASGLANDVTRILFGILSCICSFATEDDIRTNLPITLYYTNMIGKSPLEFCKKSYVKNISEMELSKIKISPTKTKRNNSKEFLLKLAAIGAALGLLLLIAKKGQSHRSVGPRSEIGT